METPASEQSAMQVEGLEILDDETSDSGTTIHEIYSFLLKNEDIILTIDASEEETLRRGLTLVKARHKKRVEESGAPSNGESKQLRFRVLERIQQVEGEDQIRIQIWLRAASPTIKKLHNMIVSDKEI